jgi:RimJ/RimL family protein N-acetyltransferase
LAELPPDAVGVDLSIGEADKLSRGIGSAVLRQFAQDLVEQGCRTIIIDPDPENERAVRAYAKAGFRPIPELAGRTGDTLIMRYEVTEIDPIR